MTNSEVVYQDGSSSKDRQNVRTEICSSKNKKRKRGGRLSPNLDYIGMCCPKGYPILAVLAINRVSNVSSGKVMMG